MPARPTSTPRSRRRTAWLAVAWALALPAAAGAATPMALYPPNTDALTRDEAADVEAVLLSGLGQAARSNTITVRDPPLLRASCGRSPSDECLAGLAAGGAVLVARARRDGVHVVVTFALVDGQGRRTRSSTFLTTLSVQDARPCAQAIWLLEDELSRPSALAPPPARGRPTPATAAQAPRRPPRPEDGTPVPPPDLTPAAPATPSAATPAAPRPAAPGGRWSTGRLAGAWIAGGGLAVVAAGALAGYRAQGLDRDLTDRFQAGTLTPADGPVYRSVQRWNLTGNVLLIAGGVVTAGGATLFFLSPSVEPLAGGGVSVGLAGRF